MNAVHLSGNKLKELIQKTLCEKSTKESTTERQEREFVSIVRQNISNGGGSISLKFGNKIITNVVDVTKVEGLAPYGKEPYTDVIIKTEDGSYNVSMKGLTAPSLMGAGATGIETLVPGWLKVITSKVVNRLLDLGFQDGDFFIDKPKDLNSVMGKIHRLFPQYDPQKITFVGYENGKEYSLASPTLPPYIGNATVEIDKENKTIRATSHISDPQQASSLPDMFFELGEDSIKTLFVGTEEMGGPVDYVYIGPMDVTTDWSEDKKELIISGTNIYTVNEYIVHYPKIYLRIRKRRVDQPFAPYESHPILGKSIFGKGVFSGDKTARIVVTNELSKNGELGGLI